MSDVFTINQELTRLCGALGTAVNEYSLAVNEAANKRTDYDVAWAKAILKSKEKTVAEREADATLECEIFMREARIAEGTRDAYKERIRALSHQLNAVQTQAAFEREEMKLAGGNYTNSPDF